MATGHSYRVEFTSGDVFDISVCSPQPARWSAMVHRRTGDDESPHAAIGTTVMVRLASSEAEAIHSACRLLTATCGPIRCKTVKSLQLRERIDSTRTLTDSDPPRIVAGTQPAGVTLLRGGR